MNGQPFIALIALLIFGCIAFGYCLGRAERFSLAAGPDERDDTEHGVGGTR